MSQATPIPNASYREILQGVGRHIDERKGVLALRVFTYSWPILILIGALTIISGQEGLLERLIDQNLVASVSIFGLWVLFSFIYSATGLSLLENEKRIWVDSFFDRQELTTKESWRIARRLFWPMFDFWATVFIRTYLLPLIILAVVFIGAPAIGIPLSDTYQEYSTNIGIAVGVVMVWAVLGFAVYVFLTELRLRFLWFIFLDTYGSLDFSAAAAIKTQDELNKVMKTEGFKQALIVDLGTDAVDIIASHVSTQIVNGAGAVVGQFDQLAGKVIGSVGSHYSKELTSQITSFGNIAAKHILYREARIASGQEKVVVNKKVYELAK